MRSAGVSSTGSPSMTLVDTRTPVGTVPANASATTRSDSPASVHRRQVEEVDARGDGRVHGRDGLVAIGRAPDLTEPATAETQDADGPERAE